MKIELEKNATKVKGRTFPNAPPIDTPIKSNSIKARSAPKKTDLREPLTESVTRANWVLSPTSAIAKRIKELSSVDHSISRK